MCPSVECRHAWQYVASVQSLPTYELMCASSWIAVGKCLVWVKRGAIVQVRTLVFASEVCSCVGLALRR